jgi:PadR family transcriptional regulator PadR
MGRVDDIFRNLKIILDNRPEFVPQSGTGDDRRSKTMKLLSRSEELVLLAVWNLQGEASCLPIQRKLEEVSGKSWSLGSIFDPLDRLERKRLLDSRLTEPTKERGGRSKRVYRLTPLGKRALNDLRSIQEALWTEADGLGAETEET